MVVAGEDDGDVVANERRLERRADDVAAFVGMLARRVQRMMEETDPPLRPRAVEGGVEPCDLRRVGRMIAVERHEPRVALVERVVVAIVHVEWLEMEL